MSRQTEKTLKWLSTILFVAAGLLLSLNIPELGKWGFIMFLIGHSSLSYIFWKESDRPLLIQNAFFILIDLIGIYRWFL